MTAIDALARAIHAHNHWGPYEDCPERLRHEEQASEMVEILATTGYAIVSV